MIARRDFVVAALLVGVLVVVSLLLPSWVGAVGVGRGCDLWNSGDISILHNTLTRLTWDTEIFDSEVGGLHAAGSGFIIVTSDDWYTVSCSVSFASGGNYAQEMWLDVNDLQYFTAYEISNNNTGVTSLDVTVSLYLESLDRVSCLVRQKSGAAQSVKSWPYHSPRFSLSHYLGGGDPASTCTPAPTATPYTPVPTATPYTPVAPLAHAVSHQDGGVDEVDVAGLDGVLGDLQHAGWIEAVPLSVGWPITLGSALVYQGSWVAGGVTSTGVITLAEHSWTHESGGLDEVVVAGLSGVLSDFQKAGFVYTVPFSIGYPLSTTDVIGYESGFWENKSFWEVTVVPITYGDVVYLLTGLLCTYVVGAAVRAQTVAVFGYVCVVVAGAYREPAALGGLFFVLLVGQLVNKFLRIH